MRPAENLLDVCRALRGESDAGLVVPERIAQISILIQRLVHHIPCEHLPGIVPHHAIDMFLKQPRQLTRREMTLGQPIGIVAIPKPGNGRGLSSRAPAQTEPVRRLGESRRPRIRPQHPPFHRVFWLQHVELAGQSGRVGGFGELRGDELRCSPATHCDPQPGAKFVACHDALNKDALKTASDNKANVKAFHELAQLQMRAISLNSRQENL